MKMIIVGHASCFILKVLNGGAVIPRCGHLRAAHTHDAAQAVLRQH